MLRPSRPVVISIAPEGALEPRDAALYAALERYRSEGGKTERAVALVARAFATKLPGEAVGPLPRCQPFFASSRQPNDDGEGQASPAGGQKPDASPSSANGDGEGQTRSAYGQLLAAPPSPQNRSDEGHAKGAAIGQADTAPSLRVVAEPSPAHVSAAKAVAKAVAVTVLDTWKIRDGRAIGDVRFGELRAIRATNLMEASLLRQVQDHIVAADHTAKVRDLIKPDVLQRMMQRAAEVADAG